LTDDSNLVDNMDLDTFSNTFFGKDEPVATETPEPEKEVEGEVLENEDDALATEQEDETEDGDEPTEEENEDEEEDKPQKPVKKTAKDRINEVVAKQRIAERERDALALELSQLKAAATKKPEANTEEPKPLREQLVDMSGAPNPDETLANGEPKYKLGEFDKEFIRDLTKYTIAQETKALTEAKAAEDQRKEVEAQQEALKSAWAAKVETAETELPDLREKLTQMDAAFAGIDPAYGEFLAATIMTCDNGPQIMYYLSQNIGEAQKIVASGASAATFALARLDAKFDKPVTEEKRNKKPSAAPQPPEARTRGTGTKTAVAPDTTDLSAFEREFYPKK
jgi:hypothetical protein